MGAVFVLAANLAAPAVDWRPLWVDGADEYCIEYLDSSSPCHCCGALRFGRHGCETSGLQEEDFGTGKIVAEDSIAF